MSLESQKWNNHICPIVHVFDEQLRSDDTTDMLPVLLNFLKENSSQVNNSYYYTSHNKESILFVKR